jgi:hypothetical protein
MELEALSAWKYVQSREEGSGFGGWSGSWSFGRMRPVKVDPSSILQALGELLVATTNEVLAPVFPRIQDFEFGISLQGDEISVAKERTIIAQMGQKDFGPEREAPPRE